MAKKQTAEYKNQFARDKYDRLEIRPNKGDKEKIKEAADQLGMSINSYVLKAIDEKIARDNEKTPPTA